MLLKPDFRAATTLLGMLGVAAGLALSGGAGCAKSKREPPAPKVELRKVTDQQFELVPQADALPHCLVFSVTGAGVLRQLTMNEDNLSFDCQPGQPIAGTRFQCPSREGKCRIWILFSDQKLTSSSVVQQLNELLHKPQMSALDLTLPGRIALETLELEGRAGLQVE